VNIVAHRHPGAGGRACGAQSLHTNSRDEALGLPTEESARSPAYAEIIAYESA